MIELKPIHIVPKEWDDLEKQIKDLFRREIYLPLVEAFQGSKKTLKNAREDLIQALQSGRLTYHRGKFSGKLNATLSQELRDLGAKWDRRQKCYSIPLADLPYDLQNVIASSSWRFAQKVASIDKKLAEVSPEALASQLKVSSLFDKTLWKVEKEFQKSVKNLTVAPALTEAQSQRIADEWQNNMQLWIKDFAAEEITKLREQIKQSVLAGNRYESAIKSIQASYRVTENKAKFLARQETNLLMSKFKEVRYADAGVHEYKWRSVSGTAQHPVRPRHKALNDASQLKGKIFRFDDPPVTTEPGEPERRNNPGEDYNCRCTAIPVVSFRK